MPCHLRWSSIAGISLLAPPPTVITMTFLAAARSGTEAARARTAWGEPFHASAANLPISAGVSAGASNTGRPDRDKTASMVLLEGSSITRDERPSTIKSKKRARSATN